MYVVCKLRPWVSAVERKPKETEMSVKSFISVAALAAATGLAASTAWAQITIPTVPIGNPGNAPDPTTGFGSVAYAYNIIGTTEVTNAQYAAFLNAKAASDPFNLYDTNMAGSFGGITRSGSPGSYTYSTISGRANNPVNFVSFWDAARFANWLHNGQGSGDTETGAYTLTPGGISANTITRNAGARWAVTNEDEWYKAAYHQPASAGGDSDNYWRYPTSSNTISTSQANYNSVIGNTTPAMSYAANFYGLFNMGGNVSEWNEAIIGCGFCRGGGGGSFRSFDNELRAGWRIGFGSTSGGEETGFRVSQIPGPVSFNLLSPTNMDLSEPLTPTFTWSASTGATSYTLRVATDAGLVNVVHTSPALTSTTYIMPGGILRRCTTYHWGVTATNGVSSIPSTPASFSFDSDKLADLNKDGSVDLVDFFEFFSCYDVQLPCAEVDGSPGVDLGDFFEFLNGYDVGC